MKTLLLGFLAALVLQADPAKAEATPSMTAPSAQIEVPPSPSKQRLIKRFMQPVGLQDRLDSGSFLEHYALPGGFEVRFKALKEAYATRKAY